MKIIIADDSRGGNAWTYARLGLARALSTNHEVIVWDIHSKNAIDMFSEFTPDIFIGQTYNIDRSLLTTLKENPQTKVVLTGSDWSQFSDSLDPKYPIVKANPKEIKLVEQLNKEHTIDLIICHYHENSINTTHEYWRDKLGIPIHGLPLAADISDYCGGIYQEEFASDVFFCGGLWGYKGISLKEWFYPLLSSELNLNVKIFGNRPWGVTQYCGFLDTKHVRNSMKSAKVCPNVSEPHSQVYGIEVNERIFKSLSNKCVVVSDKSTTMQNDFFNNGEVLFAKTPQEFKSLCLSVIHDEIKMDINKGYEKVMGEHTYFHRASTLFDYLGLAEESNKILSTYDSIRKENNL